MQARSPLAVALRLLCAVGIAVAVLAAGPAPASAGVRVATSTVAEDELSFLKLLNQERTKAGLPPMTNDSSLASTSRSWSQQMAAVNKLSHDPNLAAAAESVEPNWRSVGENVGQGYDPAGLHAAFMASSGHRANIMSTRFNRVGIGVARGGGKLWVTVRFLEGPAIAGITGLEAPKPPATRTISGDFDGDGMDDLLLYVEGSGADELLFGQADGSMRAGQIAVNGSYQPLAGDFDRDGRDEILWYAPGTAADHLWDWVNGGWSSSRRTINGTYQALTSDFDGDGFGDILWYARGTAADYYWYGAPSGQHQSVRTTINGSYRPIVGDFDGDTFDDLFWYAPGTTADFIWYSAAARGQFTSVRTTADGTSYRPFAADFDGSGTEDLFWYAPGSTRDFVWYMEPARGVHTSAEQSVGGTYLPTPGDFNGDKLDDVIWVSPMSAAGDPLWRGTRSAGFSTASVTFGG